MVVCVSKYGSFILDVAIWTKIWNDLRTIWGKQVLSTFSGPRSLKLVNQFLNDYFLQEMWFEFFKEFRCFAFCSDNDTKLKSGTVFDEEDDLLADDDDAKQVGCKLIERCLLFDIVFLQ